MAAFAQSSLVGGDAGTMFHDLFAPSSGGLVVGTEKLKLNDTYPIKQINISSGWIVDGIEIIYNLADGQTLTCTHGSKFANPSKVILNPNETVLSAFGRAGMQDYYKRDMVNSIAFVIHNRASCDVRIVGPFGNSNGSDNGVAFASPALTAIGGYAENTPNLGLSGLFFCTKI